MSYFNCYFSLDNNKKKFLFRVELLNRRLDEMADRRHDFREQIQRCEDKLEQVLNILARFNPNAINVQQSVTNNTSTNNQLVHPHQVIISSNTSNLPPEMVIQSKKPDDLTTSKATNQFEKVSNVKSRTPHYPKSNITRLPVPDNKVSWAVEWLNYNPIEYTSKTVLSNPDADNNVLA